MNNTPNLTQNHIESICKVIADTEHGIKGSEIERLLSKFGIEDTDPRMTKWKRLFNALAKRVDTDRSSNIVYKLILDVMELPNYVMGENRESFNWRQDHLNKVLSLVGLELKDDGKLHSGKVATNLSEADKAASKLRRILLSRNVHEDVLKCCRAELLENNYFHAVFEAAKSVSEKIREKTGLKLDGSELIENALEKGKKKYPLLVFNKYQTPSEINEHNGLKFLVRGLVLAVRNPHAHELRIEWTIEEEDALDMLTMISMLHRRIEKSFRTALS